jgi:hypothetical protein
VTWELIKRNPAWRAMPFFAAASAVLWVFSAPGGGGAGRTVAQALTQIQLILWIVLPEFRQRYTLLQATLPIAGRQLFLSRMVSLLAFIWLPISAAIAATVVLRGDRTWADHLPLLEAGALVTVLLLLVQCVRVRTINPPGWLMLVAVAGMLFELPIVMARLSPAVEIAMLGGSALVSAALLLQAWTGVPKSFQFAPSEPVSTRPESRGPAWPTIASWRVFQSLYGRLRVGLFLFAAFLTTLTGNGGFALLIVPAFFLDCWNRVRWLLHLPFSRRRLFWAMWLPPTAVMAAGLVLSVPFDDDQSRGPAVSVSVSVSESLNVKVPPAYWRWARGGAVPVIQAPWGEHNQPDTATWMKLVFYNPYSVSPGNSRRFLDWQFMRATNAVYGQPVANLHGLRTTMQQPKARTIVLAVALLYWLIQMCALHFSGSKRLRNVPTTIRVLVGAGPMPFAYAIYVAPLFLHIPGRGNAIMDALLLSVASALPDNLWAIVLMAALPVAGLYWLADKLFGEMEFGRFGVRAQPDITGQA